VELSADEKSLLIVAPAYILGLSIWLWILVVRSRILFRELSEKIEPALWESLGAPKSMKDTLTDSKHRWTKFIKSGDYRRQCTEEVIDLIDDFKSRQNWMLTVMGIAALMIGFRYWPLLYAAVFS